MTVRNSKSQTVRQSQVQAAALKLKTGLASRVNTARLGNLKQRIDGLNSSQLRGAKDRFFAGAFGEGFSAGKIGTQLGQLRGTAGGRSRNPLDNLGSNLMPGRGGMLSDGEKDPKKTDEKPDGKKERGIFARVGDFFKAAFGKVVGAVGGPVAGTAFSALSAPGATGTPDGPANIGEGVKTFHRMARGEYYRKDMKTIIDGLDKVPNPEDDGGSSANVLTPENIKAIKARRKAVSEPVDDGAGSGGPVNQGATTAGRNGQVGQWVSEFGSTATRSLTSAQTKDIIARLNSRINIVK